MLYGLEFKKRHSTKPRPLGEHLRSVGNRRTRPDVFALDPKRREKLLSVLKREQGKHAQKKTREEYAREEHEEARREEALRQPPPEPEPPKPSPKRRREPKSKAQKEYERTANTLALETSKEQTAMRLLKQRERYKQRLLQDQLREQIEEKKRGKNTVDRQAAAEQLQWEEHLLTMHLKELEARKRMQAMATQQTNLRLIRDHKEQKQLEEEQERFFDALTRESPRSALAKIDAMAEVREPVVEGAQDGGRSPTNRWLHNPRVRVRESMLQRLRSEVEEKLEAEMIAQRRQAVHEENKRMREEARAKRELQAQEKRKTAAEARQQRELLDDRLKLKALERDAHMLREKEDLLLQVGVNEELRRYRSKLHKLSSTSAGSLKKATSLDRLPPFWVDRTLPTTDGTGEKEVQDEMARNPLFCRRPSLGRARVSWYD